MADYRVIFNFQNLAQGWSEVWYMHASTIGDAAQRLRAIDPNVIVGWRSSNTLLRAIRCANTLNNREAVSIPVNLTGNVGKQLASGEGAEVTSVALIYNVNADAIGASRKVWLRGILDVSMSRQINTGFDVLPPAVKNQVDGYMNALAGAGFELRALAKIRPDQWTRIVSIRSAGTSGRAIIEQLRGTPNIVVGERIILTGMPHKDAPGANGQYTLRGVDLTGFLFDIDYTPPIGMPGGVNFIPTPKGRCREVTYLFSPMTTWNFLQFWSRDTGKAQGLHRGRGRVVVRKV